MNERHPKGKALYAHYNELYNQHKLGTVPASVTKSELEYAIEIMEIMAGKYGEDAGIPTEDYMCELLEKAHNSKRRVGYVEHSTLRTDAATGMVIVSDSVDGAGYIGIL